jgi:hypothetical protein
MFVFYLSLDVIRDLIMGPVFDIYEKISNADI